MIDFFYAPEASLPLYASTRDSEAYRFLNVYNRIPSPSIKRDVFELVEALANE
ncbi:MAG: hypothetical protein JKY92_03695 [Magnetovibrio sp.]|nr:hypothetical protein [Magnetovibrio sp.]